MNVEGDDDEFLIVHKVTYLNLYYILGNANCFFAHILLF